MTQILSATAVATANMNARWMFNMCKYDRGKVKYWRWTDGRQGSGYKILYLWNFIFDFVIIRYPVGSYINPHTDPVDKGRHHRINVQLKSPKEGGEFSCDIKHVVVKFPRFVWFRPDIGVHSVTEVKGSERWMFSIGWIWPGKKG